MSQEKSLAELHPAVCRWFSESFAAPTRAQVRGWASIRAGRHTLIAAPTGSGKTLAAFLIALDGLIREGTEAGELPDETRVLYVSPLKALTADVHKNLAEPRRGIRRAAIELGLPDVRVTAAIRTGDTPSSERQAMLRRPPHILVTTPESLYLLLTAERSREMLRTVRTVIVDEIHSVQESRRGAHLALSLERLEHVARHSLLRIGLSATQRPIEEVARFLVGGRTGNGTAQDENVDVAIVDEGHLRELDLAIELPGSPLEAVMSREVWEEVYERLAELIEAHRTTLVFVNTRRLAERVAYDLAGRVGAEGITAHHGSLSRERRLDAERRLKEGRLRALVATSSLELGIDIGAVDLVCQIGTVRRIATLLQRVGRSGHSVGGTPKGRIFPLTRDELVESVALVRAVRDGDLDRIRPLEAPLDVLAQQVVAEVAGEEWCEDGLFELVRRAHPYRQLSRESFDQVVEMVARGYASQRGRRAAYVHRDVINRRLKARRGARITAITSGGAIPEVADYRVVLEPSETYIGSLNEDFAIESMAGDIFQLGNATWRILRIETGTVRVADAAGEPPSIPFWFGEAPARSLELSEAVSRLREDVSERLGDPAGAIEWLASHPGIPAEAARQLVDYLGQAKHLLGVIPSLRTLVLERFFDEAGGMQLVLHAPFGSRVNRAWGLALRKRFCRSFNFELQAAATEEGVLLSLGPQHSFPLDDVFRYLHPASVREILIQALLDAPVFQTRWRWNTTISLGVLRRQGGRKVPPQIQRMQSEDLLAAVFPDAAACLENIEGDRELPDHPLVHQVIHDCLHEFCDLDVLTEVLRNIHAGEAAGGVKLVARDTPEPSTLSHEILNAKPYAFLDPAPLEERRTQAVRTRRALDPTSARELGALDPSAIARVREEARPDARDADELHDVLITSGFVTESEGRRGGPQWSAWLDELAREGRAVRVNAREILWGAVERVPELLAVLGAAGLHPRVDPQPAAAFATPTDDADTALRDVLRARMEILGPVTVGELGEPLGLDEAATERGLVALEREGTVLRGAFTSRVRSGDTATREWCDRRLLARMHRYTLERLRAEIEPVSAADYMRFLFSWQRVSPESRMRGPEGLAEVIRVLDGYELAAGAWESDVLPARCADYEPEALDTLCLTGRVGWGRLTPPSGSRETRGETNGDAGDAARNGNGYGSAGATPVRSTKIALFVRANGNAWRAFAGTRSDVELSEAATKVRKALASRGPSFFHELVEATGMLASQVEEALGHLVALGVATSDGFTGLRALLTPSSRRVPRTHDGRRRSTSPFGVEGAGRWSLVAWVGEHDPDRATEELAWALLRRYGVVFRALLAREALRLPWRDLLRTYRRLEARGEVRGGRFVSGFSGEQFALPEAVGKLRAVRRREGSEELVAVSAVDPLNLTGIVTPGPRVPALSRNRVLYRAGIPVAALIRGRPVHLGPDVDLEAGVGVGRRGPALEPALPPSLEQALLPRRIAPAVRAYVGPRR